MSTEVQRIIEAVSALTEGQRKELVTALELNFAVAPTPQRIELIRAIRGKYAHLPTSSDAFAARKREEIALEDRSRG